MTYFSNPNSQLRCSEFTELIYRKHNSFKIKIDSFLEKMDSRNNTEKKDLFATLTQKITSKEQLID